MKIIKTFLIVFVVSSIFFTGCSQQSTPDEVVEEFLAVLVLDEWQETIPFLSRDVLADMEIEEEITFVSRTMSNFQSVDFEITEEIVAGNEAEIHFVFRAAFPGPEGSIDDWEWRDKFSLEKENEKWEIADIGTIYTEIKMLEGKIESTARNLMRTLEFQKAARGFYPVEIEDVVGFDIDGIPKLISDITYSTVDNRQEYELFLDSKLFDSRWLLTSESDNIEVHSPVP